MDPRQPGRRLRNDQLLIFFADVGAQGVRALWLVPVRLGYAVVNRASGADQEAICAHMHDLSAELGTAVERREAVLHVAVRNAERVERAIGGS
jgi:hypothetical protein